MSKFRCNWILKGWGRLPDGFTDFTKPPVKCGKPTRYQMVKDDDGNTHRKHEAFCDEHAPLAKAQEDEDAALDE